MTSPAIQACCVRELVIVVGCEDHYPGAGNKLMFMGQAVRYVRGWGFAFDLTTVMHFKGKAHTDAQVAALKASVVKYGGVFQSVSAWAEVAAHVNNTSYQGSTKYVQVMLFLAHGTPGHIWLSAQEGLYFTATEAAQVNAASFLPVDRDQGKYHYRHATSWACQTGNDGKSKDQTEALKNSLAQKMANYWNISVYASVTRTEYSSTWAGFIAGYLKTSRRLIDGGLWQDEGADGSPASGEGSNQGDMKSGMHQLDPGQTSNYHTVSIS